MNRMKFHFTNQLREGSVSVASYVKDSAVPLYDPAIGFGFVSATCAMPARPVHTDPIIPMEDGFVIRETAFEAEPGFEQDHYNRFGMAFRIKAPPGAYEVAVRLTCDTSEATVSISGMQTSKLLSGGFWDAAGLVPVRHTAEANGKQWAYPYVNGREFIDIEVEPVRMDTPVGLAEIVLRPLPRRARSEDCLPTLFTLGDSTVKSYTFEEAPMSGWGQIFDDLFDLNRVNVVNYAMGGRSFKNSYNEGRFNDLLMTGCEGDYVLLQFGHNEESLDEGRRYGRGATEDTYDRFIREIYIPAIRARGMVPVLVTPVSRINVKAEKGHIYANSFQTRRFPEIMKRAAADLGVTLVDLNAESVKYYNEIGVEAAVSVFMSIEAGETPGKTNDGSYANGHPSFKNDGTHYKEALSKQLARMVAAELFKLGTRGDPVAAGIASYLKPEIRMAAATGDWSGIYPEMAADTTSGTGAYYRNQIEKLLQLGVMSKDAEGCFRPDEPMTVAEFASALTRLLGLQPDALAAYGDGMLVRQVMGALLDDAYHARFRDKPKYMTDYNGRTKIPGDPGYDPNLDTGAAGAMYYPLVPYEQLTDTGDLSPQWAHKMEDAYRLGLIRSEKGILRGRMVNGTELEPNRTVSRCRAAKALYYMWVLANPVKDENDRSRLPASGIC